MLVHLSIHVDSNNILLINYSSFEFELSLKYFKGTSESLSLLVVIVMTDTFENFYLGVEQ